MLTHEKIEKNIGLFIVLTILTVSFGGLVEIVPLFFQHSTTAPANELVKPYDPLRLAGRDIYIREGCYNWSLVSSSTIIRSSGGPSVPGRIWRALVVAIRICGIAPTCSIRVT